MQIYDTILKECLELLKTFDKKLLYTGYGNISKEWENVGDNNLILRSEMAYELGGSNKLSVSGMGFTSNETITKCDEICLYGPDLPEICRDIPYARIVIVRVLEDIFKNSNAAYSVMKKIEYTRYHVNPLGYMMRISTASEREPVRIGKDALERGLNFKKIGSIFLEEYHQHPQVEAVKLIFITDPDFPYDILKKKVCHMKKITSSLNHIFKDLKMDCTVCNLKPICDEVDGIKKLHFEVGQHTKDAKSDMHKQ